MEKLIDISRPIHEGMAIYSDNPEVALESVDAVDYGLTKISLGSHTGTHIDAPSHVGLSDEGTGIYSLDQLNGEAEVIDLSGVLDVVTREDLPETNSERVLIKTKNSSGQVAEFDAGFVALDEGVAEELVKRGVKLVGLDALSIKKKGVKDKTHDILLQAGVVILEGLWMPEVKAGKYELMCLPLNVDIDGAPTRAALRSL